MTIVEAAETISKLTGCEIQISESNDDKRDYKVSAKKLEQLGFVASKDVNFAFNEIKNALESSEIKNYKESKYNNYEFLYSSKEMQEKVFIQGI